MTKNLIKNGGLELGNTDYWVTVDSGGFIEIAAPTPVYSGTHAGKLIADGIHANALLSIIDYTIPLAIGQTCYFEVFLMASETSNVQLIIEFYDRHLDSLGETPCTTISVGTSTWTKLKYNIKYKKNARFIRPWLVFQNSSVDEYLLVDSMSLRYSQTLRKYGGIISDDKTDLGISELQIESTTGQQDILEYITSESREAQLFARGLKPPIVKLKGLFDADFEDRNDYERRLRRMLTTQSEVICVNLTKKVAVSLVPQRYTHEVDTAFWATIDKFNLTGLQIGQTLGHAFLGANCITSGQVATDVCPCEGMHASQWLAADLGGPTSLDLVFEIEAAPHKLPIGDYNFFMRTRSNLLEDTLNMEVVNMDSGGTWELVYDTDLASRFLCIKKHLNKIYAGADNGVIYISENGTTWEPTFDTLQSEVHCLESFEGHLYAGTGNNAKIFKMELAGVLELWTEDFALDHSETDVYALNVWKNKLYAGGTSQYLYRKTGGSWGWWCSIQNDWCSVIYALSSTPAELFLAVADNDTPTNSNTVYFNNENDPDTYGTWDTTGFGENMLSIAAVEMPIQSHAYLGDDVGAVYHDSGTCVRWIDSEQDRINSVFLMNNTPHIGTSPNGNVYKWVAITTLSGVSQAYSTVEGTLSCAHALKGIISCISVVTGALTIDGVKDLSGTVTASSTVSANLIKIAPLISQRNELQMEGKFRLCTIQEVALNCKKLGLPQPTLSLPLWEGAGNKIFDKGSEQHHGTLVNGPTWTDKGLYFSGATQYVDIEKAVDTTGAITVSFWYYLKDTDAKGRFAFGSKTTVANKFFAMIPAVGHNLYWYYGSAQTSASYESYYNKWTYVTLVSEGAGGGYRAIYLDGKLINAVGSSTGPSVALTIRLGHAVSGEPEYLQGKIRDFNIFTECLSSDQANTLYRNSYAIYHPIQTQIYGSGNIDIISLRGSSNAISTVGPATLSVDSESSHNLVLVHSFPVQDIYCYEHFSGHNYIGTGATGKIYRTTEQVSASNDFTLNEDYHYHWFKLPFTIKESDENDTIKFTIKTTGSTISPHIYIDLVGVISK